MPRWTAWPRIRTAAPLLALLFLEPCARAVSNVSPDHPNDWGANIGWINWLPDPEAGAVASPLILSGQIYSSNVGWISLGNGSPANGLQYSNQSSSDWGVNVDTATGQLRGFAYGANIGWVNFEPQGTPRLDLSTSQLTGFAYGANIGWINLGDATAGVVFDKISAGADSDGDGIPDSWELYETGSLAALSGNGDYDLDGQTDLQEYLAGTDPTDPNDYLHILGVSVSPDGTAVTVSWSSHPDRDYVLETSADLGPNGSWRATTPVSLTSSNGLTTAVVSPDAPAGFFRVRASGAPTP